ncbi:MAG: hypothetical protein AAGG79_04405 [Pseudomonadota bacterium]
MEQPPVLLALAFGTLFLNALVSFGFAFLWQARAILTLRKEIKKVTGKAKYRLWYSFEQRKKAEAVFVQFLDGQFRPKLRRQWFRALVYCGLSVLALVLALLATAAIELEYAEWLIFGWAAQ